MAINILLQGPALLSYSVTCLAGTSYLISSLSLRFILKLQQRQFNILQGNREKTTFPMVLRRSLLHLY